MNISINEDSDEPSQTTRSHSPSFSQHERRRSSVLLRKSSMVDMKTGHRAEAKITPFYLRWVFGMRKRIAPINLIQPNHYYIYYVSSHSGVLYDIRSKEMKLLIGHQNMIQSIACDSTGRWLVTADSGEDNAIIVWEANLCIPVNTIFNYCNENGTRTVGISPNAKYLVAVSKEAHQSVSLWLWTYGKDEPDDAIAFEPEVGKFKKLVFNPDDSCQFALMSETCVSFVLWDEEDTPQSLKSHLPEVQHPKTLGTFTDITYVNGTHQVMNTTTNGYVIIWSDVPYVESFKSEPSSHIKEHIKLIHLEENCINVIRSVDLLIATGNSLGQIRFYDQQLLLLYWCQNFTLDSITSISFNLTPRLCIFKEPEEYVPESETPPKLYRTASARSLSFYEERTGEFEELYRNLVPTDATIKENPFIVRDFIIGTATGQIGVVDFIKNKCTFILHKSEAQISAMDVHPEEKHLCIGNKAGTIFLYNYRTKDLLVQNTLLEIVSHSSSEDELDGDVQICYLKYDPLGIMLACGTASGHLWILDPALLKPLVEIPFKNAESAIKKICFSTDSKFLAIIDEAMCVCLYRCENLDTTEWEFVGIRRSHYKPISDILFNESDEDETIQLFSLGEDRMLIEYDLYNSGDGVLQILNTERIEQSAVPLCMGWYPKFTKETFLFTANNEFKFKLLEVDTKMCLKTILGPTFGSPVNLFQIFPKKEKAKKTHMIFASKQFIGIQMLPADGNPYKSVGMIGHPHEVIQMRVDSNETYLFTLGKDDFSLQMWYINTLSVDVMVRIGGDNLTPFYSLVEGGENGWLFHEIRDLFCYALIIHQGENTRVERVCSNKIPLCEMPDLMRAIGFYPSEYEIENMMHEVTHSKMTETGSLVNEIEFEDFVRLYINHHPAFGVSADILKSAFDTFADEERGNLCVTREAFLEVLLEKGENYPLEQLKQHLKILCPVKKWQDEGLLTAMEKPEKDKGDDDDDESEDEDKDDDDDEEEEEEEEEDLNKEFSFLLEELTYSNFMDDILGITSNLPTEENFKSPNV